MAAHTFDSSQDHAHTEQLRVAVDSSGTRADDAPYDTATTDVCQSDKITMCEVRTYKDRDG